MRVFLTLSVMFAALPVHAGWKRVHGGGDGNEIYSSVSVAGPDLYVSGMKLDTSARLPLPSPVLYWSQDGGQLLKSIVGGIKSGAFGGMVEGVRFLEGGSGWAFSGETVWRTTNRGTQWLAVKLPKAVSDLHFHDAQTGIAVGDAGTIFRTNDGGKTWDPVASPTAIPLKCMFWLDAQRGFAAGYEEKTESGSDGAETTTVTSGILIRTGDGGKTWTAGAGTDGLILCPIFFLRDGKTGWVATATRPPGADHSTASLHKTTDGGMTLGDTGLDVKVGTVKLFGQMPVLASFFSALYWTDEYHGHLAGSAFVVSLSSGQGSPQPVYRLVDFTTSDGGASWRKTDLGNLEVNLMGGTPPASDGALVAGAMHSLVDGIMVGEKSSVWRYEVPCADGEECPFGSVCGNSGQCEALAPAPPPDYGTEADAMIPSGDALGSDEPASKDTAGASKTGGGCAPAHPGELAIFLVAGILVIRRSWHWVPRIPRDCGPGSLRC